MAAPALGDDDLRRSAGAVFGMLAPAPDSEIDAPIARPGRMLFWDQRLSANRRVACAGCHLAAEGSSDRRRQSIASQHRQHRAPC